MTMLRKAFGITTWVYNQCLYGIKYNVIKPTIGDCRTHYLNAQSRFVQRNPEMTDVPYDIRDEAALDLIRAQKSVETKKTKGDKASFYANFNYQRHHRKNKKIVIHAKHYKSAGLFWPSYFGSTPFKCREKLPEKLDYSANLTLNWLGQVHLHVPRPLEKHTERQPAPHAVAAIDPGVRTFGTVYDPQSNLYTEWGKGAMARLQQIAWDTDQLKTRIASRIIGHRKRYRLRKVLHRKDYKIQNMVKDFHYRFANWLCQNYKVILLPTYEITQMVRRRIGRKIRKSTARAMLTWSPCMFRDRLKGVSRRYPDCHVVSLSEAYTTKTCRCCGALNNTVGGSTVFKCPSCKVKYGRDFGGSSNILLRHVTFLKEDLHESAYTPPEVDSSGVDTMMHIEEHYETDDD
jgi:transposase